MIQNECKSKNHQTEVKCSRADCQRPDIDVAKTPDVEETEGYIGTSKTNWLRESQYKEDERE